MRILITGSSGTLGRGLMRAAKKLGYNDILTPSSSELDLFNESRVASYLRTERPTVIIHAAAKVSNIQGYLAEPLKFFDQNIVIDRNVILGATACGVEQLINITSSTIYSDLLNSPKREADFNWGVPPKIYLPYAAAKRITLQYANFANEDESQLKVCSLIAPNFYATDEEFLSLPHVIPEVIRKISGAISNGDINVKMWGSGTIERDFVDVDDVSNFIFSCLIEKDNISPLINIGTGSPIGINEIYKTVATSLGYRGEITADSSKPDGPEMGTQDLSQLDKLAPSMFKDPISGLNLILQRLKREI